MTDFEEEGTNCASCLALCFSTHLNKHGIQRKWKKPNKINTELSISLCNGFEMNGKIQMPLGSFDVSLVLKLNERSNTVNIGENVCSMPLE
eukprot:391444_1